MEDDIHLPVPESWFYEWHSVEEILAIARQCNRAVPNHILFNQSKYHYILEAWCAAEFTASIRATRSTENPISWNGFSPESVRLIDERFPDFELTAGSIQREFEVTEALDPDRLRGKEYAEAEKIRQELTNESGNFDLSALDNKVHTKLAEICIPFKSKFSSIWFLADPNIFCTHPKNLRANWHSINHD